jgi:hypothetical protein
VAREKLSTESGDNSAEKISGAATFPCFQPLSLIRPLFRHFCNYMNLFNKEISAVQAYEMEGHFMTVP